MAQPNPNNNNNNHINHQPPNTNKQNGYHQQHKNDNDSNNDNKNKTELLKLGLLTHHEIENFHMEEEKIEKACNPVTWSNCDATTFNVRRGPNYIPGQKSPSKKALYTAFAMDAYKLPFKIHKIFKYMNIDKYIKQYDVPYDKEKFPLPPLFMMNVMVPNYPPELMGGKSDGNGYQIILYAHLSREIRETLLKYAQNPQNIKLLPAVKLLSNFIHSDLVNSEIRNRFKVIARIMNSQYTDFGFLANRLVKRYNGKPFLARTSSTFYHEPGKYFAADIDAHVFGYPARQGLSYVKNSIQTAIYDVGLVVEGHSDDELPEQILSCCRISKIGINLCKPFPSSFMKQYMKEKNIESQSQSHEMKTDHDDHAKSQYINEPNTTSLSNKPYRNGGVQSKSSPSLPNAPTMPDTQSQQSGNSNNDIKQQQTNQSSLTSKILGGWGYFG